MKRLLSMILTVLFVLFAFCGCSDDHLIGNTSFSDSEVTEDGINSEISQTESKEVAPESAESSEEPISYEIGKTFYFGSYEQDNDTSNGKEPIEWIVLDKKDDTVFVVSKFILDCQPYHTEEIDMTWEQCSLRTWLNSTFLNAAFDAKEQSRICDTEVVAEDSLAGFYPAEGGNNTIDKMFLLSRTELKQYFETNAKRISKVTEYVSAKDELREERNGGSCWWSRTPGGQQNRASHVAELGSFQPHGLVVTGDSGVRPAMWIKIK